MRTQLSEFCQDFNRIARPLLSPVEALLDACGEGTSEHPLQDLRSDLKEVRHQLTSLVVKVEEQQAYVLIFGPLKSGKSTLMNAIAAAYVSEVSSLPAYPCLVFVSHGSKKEFRITDYAGKTESFSDGDALHKRVGEAHAQLAESMRKAEEAGDHFDPQEHFPAAIRRADVKVPAKNLEDSAAVLVDTPGLYTRMRFGYDRMTQEFRNAAACAIFVVKSDTLFLEQVFSEFHQLLDLFSRIFLVVNMDTAKQDVGPDGKLHPSLEQRAPESIIAAFEQFAMTAPIKQAAADGKVRIYPVDLMNAARVSLQKPSKSEELPAGFINFRDDLKEYLESVEYLKAFLGDSMRRAQNMAAELRALISGDEISELQDEDEDLAERKSELEAELERLETCLKHDWSKDLKRFAKDISSELNRRSPDLDMKLGRAVSAAIDTWFRSGHSLGWLIEKQWKPLLGDHRNDMQMVAMQRFEESCVPGDAGVDLAPEAGRLLRSFGIEIKELRKSAQLSQGKPVWPPMPDSFVDPESIPVRRSIVDVLAFRSVDSVRQRLFGTGKGLEKKITAKAKAARLGDSAKQHIRAELMPLMKELMQETVDVTRRRFCDELERATADEVERRLRGVEPNLRSELQELEAERAEIKKFLDPVGGLHKAAGTCLEQLEKLSTRYAATDPDLLLKPLDPEERPVRIASKSRKKPSKSRKSTARRAKRRTGRGGG